MTSNGSRTINGDLFFPFYRRPAIHHENEILSFLSDARFLFNIFDTGRNAETRSIFARKFLPRFFMQSTQYISMDQVIWRELMRIRN